MTQKQKTVVFGALGGVSWALALFYIGGWVVTLPVFALMPTIMTAFLLPGLALAAIIARISQRRFFHEDYIDGQQMQGGAEIDQRVLRNTVEQLVLAMAIWPAAAVMLGARGPGVIIVLGVGFTLARMAFWAGYHRAPTFRAFGFAATFYPTVLVAVWAVLAFLF